MITKKIWFQLNFGWKPFEIRRNIRMISRDNIFASNDSNEINRELELIVIDSLSLFSSRIHTDAICMHWNRAERKQRRKCVELSKYDDDVMEKWLLATLITATATYDGTHWLGFWHSKRLIQLCCCSEVKCIAKILCATKIAGEWELSQKIVAVHSDWCMFLLKIECNFS